MNSPAIVVVTFNRPVSLKRLLGSIASANYAGQSVPLVISIDFQDSPLHKEVVDIANGFDWKYGEKRVIEHKKNLGLRSHILQCGTLTKEYGGIIVLEDDIYVSPQFYSYSITMLDRYGHDEKIAGISLYQHLWNVNAGRPFLPESDGNDVYFMQFAQSWGQCWSRRMWEGFNEWYQLFQNSGISQLAEVPAFVRSWSDKSWLKFHIAYVTLTDKYFVYPSASLSTNFNDIGSHVKNYNCIPQVPMRISPAKYDRLPSLKDGVRYDVFFERDGLGKYLDLADEQLCVDLYGIKGSPGDKRFWLTTVAAPYTVIRSFGLDQRPLEHNVILNNQGRDIFLYDCSIVSVVNKTNPAAEIKQILFDIRDIDIRKLSKLLFHKIKSKFK